MDWLIEAGHRIQRIEDYDEWVSRFETAMRGLPEKQRQESVLTVLDAYRHPAEVIAGLAIPSERFRPPCVRSALQHSSVGVVDRQVHRRSTPAAGAVVLPVVMCGFWRPRTAALRGCRRCHKCV